MKKLSTLLLALPLAALAGCSSSGPGGSDLFPGGGDGNGADAASDSTILMSQAVMGIDLLGSGSPSTTPLRRAKATKNVQVTDEATLANEILDYIEDFDSILGYEPGQIEQLTSDYIRTATAKGIPRRRVIVTYALKNALIPVITVASIQIGSMLVGAVLVESVFAMGGLGDLLISGIKAADYPLVQSITLLMVFVFLCINLIVDIFYAVLDPRIRMK